MQPRTPRVRTRKVIPLHMIVSQRLLFFEGHPLFLEPASRCARLMGASKPHFEKRGDTYHPHCFPPQGSCGDVCFFPKKAILHLRMTQPKTSLSKVAILWLPDLGSSATNCRVRPTAKPEKHGQPFFRLQACHPASMTA